MDTGKDLSFFTFQRATPSWADIIVRIGQDIEEPLRTNGLHAVSVFRKILGERFFTENGHDHPLQDKWGNISAWQITQLCEWANVLEQLQHSQEDVAYLSELLKKREKCQQEGIHFLRIAASLLRTGFRLRFIRGRQDSKSPDIEVLEPNTNEIFYIEVTHLEKKEKLKLDDRNFNFIGNACLHYAFNLLTSVQLLRSLKEEELEMAISIIANTARKACELNSLQVSRNEFIDIAFAPLSDGPAFEAWLGTHNRRKGVNGVTINPDETERITQRGRIEKKVKQFPTGATGIIYMGVEFLYFLCMDRDHVFTELKKAMTDHSQLKGIILCCDVIDPQESGFEEYEGREDIYSIHCQDAYATMYLYCVNDSYKGNTSEAVLYQLRNSLIPTSNSA